MNKELITTNWNKTSGTGIHIFSSDGITMTGGLVWLCTDYIPLPTGIGIIYEFDYDISVTANDQIYILVERFDANKGTISNNAATNCVSGYKPSSNVVHERRKGTIDIATFNNGTQTAYIRVRTCNGYNSTTGTYTLHSWSLRAVSGNRNNQSVKKNGLLLTDNFRENFSNASFDKNGFIEGLHFYEY